MATQNPLNTILKRLDNIDTKLESISKIEKNIIGIKKDINVLKGDIKTIKDCVSTENAKEFPRIRKTKRGGKGSGAAMAAASK